MKKYTIQLISFTILMTAAFVFINWLVDPHRIFHSPWVRDNYYVKDMRIEASGIINSDLFDSIILGTSMAENFSPAEASKIFNREFVNLSLSGSSIAERSVVLNYALRKKHLKEVIFSVDSGAFSTDPINSTPIASYAYLYDENPLNDIMIFKSGLSDLRFAFCSNVIFPSKLLCHKMKNRENLTEWYSDKKQSERFGGLDKWIAAKNNIQIKAALQDLNKSISIINSSKLKPVNKDEIALDTLKRKQVFENYLLFFAAKYPKVKFNLFFPPYSRMYYAINKQSNPYAYEIYLETLRFVVSESKKYNNVQVFGFENESFLDNLANYKDTIHHHPKFNSYMLKEIKNGEHVLTTTNVEKYINYIDTRAYNYPLEEIGNKINAALQ